MTIEKTIPDIISTDIEFIKRYGSRKKNCMIIVYSGNKFQYRTLFIGGTRYTPISSGGELNDLYGFRIKFKR